MDADVVLHPDGEILRQGDGFIRNAVQVGEHGVEAVGDVREGGGVLPVAEGHKGEIQDFVAAVGEENFIPFQSEAPAGLLHQIGALGVGIQLQILCRLRCQPDCLRGGREGGLVGVQLDIAHGFGLLSRGVGHQRGVLFTEKTTHCLSSSVRMRALLAWPVRPSALAKRATSSATAASASRV